MPRDPGLFRGTLEAEGSIALPSSSGDSGIGKSLLFEAKSYMITTSSSMGTSSQL